MEKTIVQDVYGLFLSERVLAEVYRHRPRGGYFAPERVPTEDLITNNGRIFLAQRIGLDVNSPIAHMAVGTMTTAASLNDSVLSGEVLRKALSFNSADANNQYTAIATFGGAADSITSIQITEVGLFNHANSGQGTMYQRITQAAVTLADSDLLKMTLQTIVGSNTI